MPAGRIRFGKPGVTTQAGNASRCTADCKTTLIIDFQQITQIISRIGRKTVQKFDFQQFNQC